MSFQRVAALSAVASMTIVLAAGNVSAAPISKCNAVKKKCIGKYVAAVLACHAKAEGSGAELDGGCVAKAVAKVTGGGKGCFDKQDAIAGNDCGHTGDAVQMLEDADALILDVVTDVDPGYPTAAFTKCGAARKKCLAKEAAGLMACSAKLNKDGTGDAACATQVRDKFGGAKGCDPKVVTKGHDCLGSTDTATLAGKVDAWEHQTTTIFDYSGPPCGNGLIDPGEACDPAAPNRAQAACGADFPCNATTCNCACPSTVHFVADAASASSRLDLGWTGIAHGTPVVSNGDVTLTVSGCAGSERPCGTCNTSGPIPNGGATELRSRRCTNDTATQCSDDAACLGGGGTCQYFFGSTLPISAGGVATCTLNQFAGPIAGTLNLESGEAATTASLIARVHVGIATDTPCPRCVGDATANDGVQDGTCSDGAHAGDHCDANAVVPGRPDFGATSLDCPPIPAALVAALPIDLTNATADVVKTLTNSSPTCSGSPGTRCLCDTCNSPNREPCDDAADCSDPDGPIGPICGGRTCIGGPNVGAACTANSQCPASACIRPGEPTRATPCIEDTSTGGLAPCEDTAPVDGEGACLNGPIDRTCSAPHEQRGCNSDDDCTPGTCEAAPRRCFLTGGGVPALPGTGTLVAAGAADPPAHDTASPTLAAVFCVGPTAAPAINNVTGLPGPARLTLHGTATGHP